MLLNKKLFNKYYKEYYTLYFNKSLNNKYLTNIIKNDIGIAFIHILNINNNNVNIYNIDNTDNNITNNKKKIHYNNIIFFDYYKFFVYLIKKYRSYSCEKILNNFLKENKIKEYKNCIYKNIRWMK
tara:strand:- start:81 stop:458 length:378 start_codon:yes stop_codon:yes gene_type:complete